jgi:hypothetical protein
MEMNQPTECPNLKRWSTLRSNESMSGEQFLEGVKPLMVRLFCLPAEDRTGAMAALLGGIEERLENVQAVSRADFLALFQWALDNERCEDTAPHELVSPAGQSL